MNVAHLLYPSVHGHINYLCVLATLNSAAVNVDRTCLSQVWFTLLQVTQEWDFQMV